MMGLSAVEASSERSEGSWPPRALVFDCYGTLLRITDQRRPYLRLAEIAGGRLDPSPMVVPLSLAEVAAHNVVPIDISSAELATLEFDLEAEISSVIPIADAMDVLARLRTSGFRLAVLSNLASPYAAPVRRRLGAQVDAQVFSFEIGAVKPSPIAYGEVCDRLKVQPEDALMIGDSMNNDYRGAISAGLQARHIASGMTVNAVLKDLL